MGIISHFPGGSAGGGTGLPEFTYENGVCQLIDDGDGNWRIKFLTSGTLTFTKLGSAKGGVDVFCVGGGASGGGVGFGGGGGYTKTATKSVIKDVAYQIVIGAGGAGVAGNASAKGNDGGTTSALGVSATGGQGGKSWNQQGAGDGSGGASGGGATGGKNGQANVAGGAGGADGSDGGSSQYWSGGTGQGTTTREFGESGGDVYAGGGGGWGSTAGAGGNGGGGAGNGTNGKDNTGGGGGAANGTTTGSGGSGIVIIRNTRQHAIKITQQPQDVTAAESANAVFTVTATGTGLSYQWQFLPTGSNVQWSDTSATGAKTHQLTVQALSYRNGYQYHCVITDSNGNQVTSAEATLTVS